MKELKGINIKGNEYILVKDRVLYFNENYPNGKIETELLSEIDNVVGNVMQNGKIKSFKVINLAKIDNTYFIGEIIKHIRH